jgi:ribonuclease BN (tRNA processing enzyme)
MKLAFLGTGAALSSGRSCGGLLLGDGLLLDCGPAAVPHLRRLGKEPGALSRLLVTHLHADHTFGLPFLLCERAFRPRRARRLAAGGPPGLEAHARQLLELGFPDVAAEVWSKAGVDWHELGPGRQSLAGLPVEVVEMDHPPLTAYGYRIAVDGEVVAFSGDTGPGEGLDRLVEGATLAIVEWTLDIPLKGHLARADVQALRARLPSSTRLFAVHRGEEGEPPPGVHVPADLEEALLGAPLESC